MRSQDALVEAGGAIVGLGVAAMHYVAIAGYKVAGDVQWSSARASAPVGAAVPLILAIVSTHFLGMAGMTIVPDAMVAVPREILSVGVMTSPVGAVMIIILLLGASTTIIDMQSTEAAVARYRHLSLHDPLTNLANRFALNEHLATATKSNHEVGWNVAVLSFDLDRIKEINDVYGHAAGDAVLRAVGERLAKVMQKGQFADRVGGDEFAVVMCDHGGSEARSVGNGCSTRSSSRSNGTVSFSASGPASAFPASPTGRAASTTSFRGPMSPCTAPKRWRAAASASTIPRWTRLRANAMPWRSRCAKG